jgi:cellulose synthase/poly-beta-1,6-N-acetylglucosamine synthase-like glycosyltransferase
MMLFLPFTVWQVLIGLFGLIKNKPIPQAKGQFKFAVLICAKDEQAVIGNLIDSINRQNYNRDNYTVFVVADNCKDQTAKEAAKYGAIVLERFNHSQIGKGYAMKWAIDIINDQYEDCFDAFTVFDADNLADQNFLLHTNDALQNGADITQGYRDTKNPYDSTISGCYSIYWLILMRFFHCARRNLGLSCMVGGTGFAFKSSLVKNGFSSKTLTEDVEFSLHQILKGKKIFPVKSAVFYDEQPTELRQSLTQRLRWLSGGVQCASYILPSIRKYSTRQPLKFLGHISRMDSIIYMLSNLIMPIATIIGALSLITTLMLAPGMWLVVLKDNLITVLMFYAALTGIGALTLMLEKKPVLKYMRSILFFPVFTITFALLSVAAIMPRKVEWKAIEHTCVKEISEIANIP